MSAFKVLLGLVALCAGLAISHGDGRTQTSATTELGEVSLNRFIPRPAGGAIHLDWKAWDDALSWFVLGMGPSLRDLPPKRDPSLGSRFVFGHDSRYRMEGNRVAFQFLEDKQRAALTEYREDLERIAGEIDIATLPRNEQLAFWINLHNVAIIEQLALHYPVMSPRKVEIGGVPLDEARFITVSGMRLSPRDIRTGIVYLHWDDPRVIYGFFHGDIGGPSIARRAYNGHDIARQLAENATEFVNALRGVDRSSGTLKVSRLYNEARPFFFRDYEADLRAHLAEYAEDEVQSALAASRRIEASLYETDIADLSKGEREPVYSQVDECPAEPGYQAGFSEPGSCPRRIDIPLAVQRFTEERHEKIAKLIERGKIGTVIIREIRDGNEAGAEVK